MSLAKVCILAAVFAAQTTTGDLDGRFISKNTYENSALGLRITFRNGQWRPFTKEEEQKARITRDSVADANCNGPLCGSPTITVALTSASFAPAAALFLQAYRPPKQYLDRSRYPLERFAKVMLTGSMSATDWRPDGPISPIQLDGKPAFKIVAHRPPGDTSAGKDSVALGYVAENNGFIFLIIGTVPFGAEIGQLQDAIEHAELTAQH